MKTNKKTKRVIRHRRVRAKIKGTALVPRICVFRSNRHIYCQLIDDEKNKTIIIASDIEVKLKGKKSEVAGKVGELLAKKAQDKKIEKAVFDRSGYQYHGRVKALADGARKGGLKY